MKINHSINPEISSCLNCSKELPPEGEFCPYCAQKRTTGRITIKDLLVDFFENVFNLDSKFFLSIRDLFIPGRLTQLFFAGKHKSYYAPVRLFFISMLAFFAIAGFFLLGDINADEGKGLEIHQAYHDKIMMASLDSAYQQFIRQDTTAIAAEVLDSFKMSFLKTYNPNGDAYLKLLEVDPSNLGTFQESGIRIPYSDLIEFSEQEIIEKYNIQGFWNQLYAKQSIKILTDLNGVLRFAIGNITWMLIILMPIVGAFMKLLYIRKKHFYVEHLIFLFHFHSFLFLLLSVFIILYNFLPSNFGLLIFLAAFAYLFFALKNYYKQGVFKTFSKQFILVIVYVISANVTALITLLISFALF